jgi:hypothetical protein
MFPSTVGKMRNDPSIEYVMPKNALIPVLWSNEW